MKRMTNVVILLVVLLGCRGFDPPEIEIIDWLPGAQFEWNGQSTEMTVLDGALFNHTEMDTIDSNFLSLKGRLAHRDCYADCPNSLDFRMDYTRDSLVRIMSTAGKNLIGKEVLNFDSLALDTWVISAEVGSALGLDSLSWKVLDLDTITCLKFEEDVYEVQVPNVLIPFIIVHGVDILGNTTEVTTGFQLRVSKDMPYLRYEKTLNGVRVHVENSPDQYQLFWGGDSSKISEDYLDIDLTHSQWVDVVMMGQDHQSFSSFTHIMDHWYYDHSAPNEINAVQIKLKSEVLAIRQFDITRGFQSMDLGYTDVLGQRWTVSPNQPLGSYMRIVDADLFEENENGQPTAVIALEFKLDMIKELAPTAISQMRNGSAIMAIPIGE